MGNAFRTRIFRSRGHDFWAVDLSRRRACGGRQAGGHPTLSPFVRSQCVMTRSRKKTRRAGDDSSPPTDKEMWKKRAIPNIPNLKISGGRRGKTEKSLQSKTAQAHKGVPLSRLDGARTHVRTERCYEQGVGPHRNFLHPSSFSKYAEMNRASRDRTRALSSSTFKVESNPSAFIGVI